MCAPYFEKYIYLALFESLAINKELTSDVTADFIYNGTKKISSFVHRKLTDMYSVGLVSSIPCPVLGSKIFRWYQRPMLF
jgi:hypothetical protein